MSMSTEDALKYLNVEVNDTPDQSSDRKDVTETKTDTLPTSDNADEKNNKKEDRQNVESVAESDESAAHVEQTKAEHTKVDDTRAKRDYAFIREKNKRKAQRERYESEIKALKDELEKYKGLKLDDFKGDQQSYIDYRLDQMNQERRMAEKQQTLDNLDQEDLAAENERRVNLSFADENERREYLTLLEEHGAEFKDALDKFDTEHVVMSYLNDLEQYPKVLKVLMTDKDALRSVFAKRDPTFRKLALDKLANKILAPTVTAKAKAKLPVIGRQTSANPVSESNRTHDAAYWNNYLRNHPRGKYNTST